MAKYGYINEGGYLKVKHIEEYTETYREGTEQKMRTVTLEEQAAKLIEKGWKEVDEIDYEKVLNPPEGYVIRLVPYDAGDRISYRYEEVEDLRAVRKEVAALKAELSESDYKVLKMYEASLLGEELPYDASEVISERREKRERINVLEVKLSEK